MSKLSEQKKQKISEQILSLLYDNFPKPLFTSKIADELARDEEFIKNLLQYLNKKEFVVLINKNPKGILYTKRARWRLSNKTCRIFNTFSKEKIKV